MGDIIDISEYRGGEKPKPAGVVKPEYNWDDPHAPWNRNLAFHLKNIKRQRFSIPKHMFRRCDLCVSIILSRLKSQDS